VEMLDSRTIEDQVNRLLTTEDICKMFQVTYMTVYTWKNKRGLPCVTINGENRATIRYHPDDVNKWAAREGLRPLMSRRRLKVAA